jgi:anion-transporting  ArsA/GET3 family ATPase
MSPARSGHTTEGLDALLAAREMVIVAGSGGVGKTTVSAALAAAAAVHLGGRVLVITVDPARRLADALGVGALGNTPTQVDPELLAAASGRAPEGELWAAMLDTKAGWDELIARHAPDPELRDTVLANPLYQNLTSRFVHSHDYLAMEQLHELHGSGRYDLIVVDTPPSRNALALIDAPRRMREFFGSRLLKWLTTPYRSKVFSAASRPFTQIADRILGSHFVEDIAEFFTLFQTMEPTFVRHADEVEALLGDLRTAFVVVTTLETAPVHEAIHLSAELTRRTYPLAAIVTNRALPRSYMGRAAATSARRLGAEAADRSGAMITAVAGRIDAPVDQVASVLTETAERFGEIALLATREAERRSELAEFAPLLVAAPPLDHDVNDLSDLLELAQYLRGAPR